MEPILIDTDLLVYIFDERDRARQEAAIQIVRLLAKSGIGRLSAQCLSEFFNATTKRKDPILSVPEAADQTEKLARAFVIFPITQQVVLEALRGVLQHKLQFWDAQIWSAARLNQVSTVFSENFGHEAVMESVRFINPFAQNFQLQDWIQ